MKKGKIVPVTWTWIYWSPEYKWDQDIVPQLTQKGISVNALKRSVYVIRVNGNFAIEYQKKSRVSPVLYIGEGNFRQRLYTHTSWLTALEELVGNYSFEIGIALPRVQNYVDAYKDCEAALIHAFKDRFGSAPLVNKQMERRRRTYEYSARGMSEAMGIGKGVRYLWAIKPMPASKLYKLYRKTMSP